MKINLKEEKNTTKKEKKKQERKDCYTANLSIEKIKKKTIETSEMLGCPNSYN